MTRRPTSRTEEDQIDVESTLASFLKHAVPALRLEQHAGYLARSISKLPDKSQGLHPSRPWLVFWTLQAADVLGELHSLYRIVQPKAISDFLMMCFERDTPNSGGFAGGPLQIPHLAPSYAAVCAFSILSSVESFAALPRSAIENWIVSLRQADGSFRMHNGGESDVRATYCAAIISKLLNLEAKRIFSPNCLQYVASCQTHEGGFGCDASVGFEAHGGYSQCAIASMILLFDVDQTTNIDVERLKDWCSRRQGFGGGFSGRTNKLIDACYSFWIGSTWILADVYSALQKLRRGVALTPVELALLNLSQILSLPNLTIPADAVVPSLTTVALHQCDEPADDEWESVDEQQKGLLLWDQVALQTFLLSCCQSETGGLMDKPYYGCDAYHTCYALAGLSLATDSFLEELGQEPVVCNWEGRGWIPKRDPATGFRVLATGDLHVRSVNPIFNLVPERVVGALQYFSNSSILL